MRRLSIWPTILAPIGPIRDTRLNRATSEEWWPGASGNPKAVGIAPPTLRSSSILKLLLCLCAGVTAAQAPAAATSLIHKKAPEFVRTDLQQRKLDLRTYRGKVVLLDFWATWCASCQREMPRFVTWQTQYGSRGLQIIGISMDDDPELARKMYEKQKLNYPVATGDEKLGR